MKNDRSVWGKGVLILKTMTGGSEPRLTRIVIAEAAIQRVRDLHQPFNNNPPVSFCRACKGIYPCPTIKALDGAAARGGEHEHSWERLYGEKTHHCECGAYLKDDDYGGEQV